MAESFLYTKAPFYSRPTNLTQEKSYCHELPNIIWEEVD